MRLITLVALLLAAAALAPAATANAPIRQTVTFTDVTFPDTYLSDACGTDVVNTASGTIDITVFLDRSGTPVREIDLVRGTITFRAPATGKSVTQQMIGISHATYPNGVAPGSPAPTSLIGLNVGSFTGVAPPGAGRLQVDARVVAVGPDGVPFTSFGTEDIVSAHGTFARATADICSALT
jgi:hypothetical protein